MTVLSLPARRRNRDRAPTRRTSREPMPTADSETSRAPPAPRLAMPQRRATALALVCGICGLLGWALWLLALREDPGQDWMVFYTAARAYFEHRLPLVFDGEALTAAVNQRFAG